MKEKENTNLFELLQFTMSNKAYLPGTKVNDPSMDPKDDGRGVQLS